MSTKIQQQLYRVCSYNLYPYLNVLRVNKEWNKVRLKEGVDLIVVDKSISIPLEETKFVVSGGILITEKRKKELDENLNTVDSIVRNFEKNTKENLLRLYGLYPYLDLLHEIMRSK